MINAMELEFHLQTVSSQVDKRLGELLPLANERPSELHEAMRYSCLAPGKRLRPALVIASCQAVGGTLENALDAACVVEMIHCFSLIHDDLPAIDNDDLRRGLPTCHVRFGEAVAILAGDALFALAFSVLGSMPASDTQIVQCLKVLANAVGTYGLVGGETIDVLSEGKVIDEETLELIHLRKTASLIAASCEIGAILGSASPKDREGLRQFGQDIGLAFQIADDVLNETGTPEQLGKAAGSDRERQKATYPAIYGVEKSQAKAMELSNHASVLVSHFANANLLKEIAKYSVQRMK